MSDDAVILSFDTSGPWLEVSLLRGVHVMAARSEAMAKGQGEALMPALEDVLQQGGVTWTDLTAVGVGVGPGNFTGIRISVSAARGLALALDIPAVGVSVLEARALGQSGPVLALREAPRDAVYAQGFGPGAERAADLWPLDAMGAELSLPGLVCVGDRAEEVAQRIGAQVASPQFGLAEAIGRIAMTRFADSVDAPAPMYLKPADAAPSREAPPVILDDA